MFGIDYSVGFPGTAPLKAAGVQFVARYLSPPGNIKNLTAGEAKALLAAGIGIAVVWETWANRALSGNAGGVADAKAADALAKSFGFAGIPIYFAVDWDATLADQAAINAYFDGVASVIGRGRTGIYGGFWPVKRTLDAGKAAFAWQTYAWSGGLWDKRAQLQQYNNGAHVAGIECDLDRSMAADFGQWPRPNAKPEDLVLFKGWQGAAVTYLQQRLNVWGAKLAVVDGVFGDETDKAVRAFQTAHKLSVDGVVGKLTWAELDKSPAPPPPPPPWYYPAPAVKVVSAGRTSVKFQVTPASDPHGAPDHYQVYVYKGTVCSYKTIVPSYPRMIKGTLLQTGGLARGTTYTMHVVAAGVGESHVKPSTYATVTFKTS